MADQKPGPSKPQSASAAEARSGGPGVSSKPFVVEYYYTAKWGHAEEFITLFDKNHLPVLLKQVELGRICRLRRTRRATTPPRMAAGITGSPSSLPAPAPPSTASMKRAWRRSCFPTRKPSAARSSAAFEILQAHWDLPIKSVELHPNAPTAGAPGDPERQ